MKKAIMSIGKMECNSCAKNIERSLNNVQGAKVIKINVSTKEGIVECDNKVNEADLTNAVKKAGYNVNNIKFEKQN